MNVSTKITAKMRQRHQKKVDDKVEVLFKLHGLEECKTAKELKEKGYMLICDSNRFGSHLTLLKIIEESTVNL